MTRAKPIAMAECVSVLRAHMPELVPTLDALVERFAGVVEACERDEFVRFLTLWNPPRLVRACSQLVCDTAEGPMLVRSYDHHPRLFDGVVLGSAWNDASVLAMTDCLWGALDGMNEHGLAVALAFGGRRVVGEGFAAPLIVRYVLETCATAEDAREVLARVPSYMPYTFSVVDAEGEFVTAFLGPGRTPRLVARRAATNHQGAVEWGAYAKQTQSVRRLEAVESLLHESLEREEIVRAFLREPIWRSDYERASGTLYVARYDVGGCELELCWPSERRRVPLAGDGVALSEIVVPLGESRA